MTATYRRQAGFSLVEIMVALVAGLIVIGSVLAFTVASVRSNAEYVQATRLEQELRSAMDLVAGDLRRAGYDERAVKNIGLNYNSAFARLRVNDAAGAPPTIRGNCVVYAYDRPGGTAGTLDLANGEVRAIRRVVTNGRGALELAQSTNAVPDCSAATADYASYPAACTGIWCPLTDPRVLDITQFQVANNLLTIPGTSPIKSVRLRELNVWLQGRLTGRSTDTVRAIDTRIKVRADCVRAPADIPATAAGDCELAPGA